MREETSENFDKTIYRGYNNTQNLRWITCLALHLYQIWWVLMISGMPELIGPQCRIFFAYSMRQKLHNQTRPRSRDIKKPLACLKIIRKNCRLTWECFLPALSHGCPTNALSDDDNTSKPKWLKPTRQVPLQTELDFFKTLVGHILLKCKCVDKHANRLNVFYYVRGDCHLESTTNDVIVVGECGYMSHIHCYSSALHNRKRPLASPDLWGESPMMSWWRHQMDTFSALMALFAGNLPVTGGFLAKGQWHGALMFSLICAWTNSSANNRDAGDLRCHCAHYDVTVMVISWGNRNIVMYQNNAQMLHRRFDASTLKIFI